MRLRRKMRKSSGGRGGGGKSARMKVKKLQRLIPGGKGLEVDQLLLRTADYILHLRLQLNVLQALSKIHQPASSI
ncbi:hypothetical protein SLE2022_377140 [Rubroshorea leprosula]